MSIELDKEYIPKTFVAIPECFLTFTTGEEVIGAANIINKENSFYLFNFEVSEQGKGYGRLIVEAILKTTSIEGIVTPDSEGFWEKMGAEIKKDGSFVIKKKGV